MSLYGIQFIAYKAGEQYSARFAFFHSLTEAKKAAIELYKSSPNIDSVIATDKETGKVIKKCPDKRGGVREGGGKKTYDGEPRNQRLTLRVAQDVWDFLVEYGDKSECIHRAVRMFRDSQK